MDKLEYVKEIENIVYDALHECFAKDITLEDFEEKCLEYIFKTIKGHQWVIYYCYHLDVFKYSDTDIDEPIEEGIVDANYCIKEGGINNLFTVLAHCLMEKDCIKELQKHLEDFYKEETEQKYELD